VASGTKYSRPVTQDKLRRASQSKSFERRSQLPRAFGNNAECRTSPVPSKQRTNVRKGCSGGIVLPTNEFVCPSEVFDMVDQDDHVPRVCWEFIHSSRTALSSVFGGCYLPSSGGVISRLAPRHRPFPKVPGLRFGVFNAQTLRKRHDQEQQSSRNIWSKPHGLRSALATA
jgi:hypothetical protein